MGCGSQDTEDEDNKRREDLRGVLCMDVMKIDVWGLCYIRNSIGTPGKREKLGRKRRGIGWRQQKKGRPKRGFIHGYDEDRRVGFMLYHEQDWDARKEGDVKTEEICMDRVA